VGLEGIAQVDLDIRQNAHQPLRDLGPMAFAVMRALATRLERDGRLQGPLPAAYFTPGDDELPSLSTEPAERPPLCTLRAAA
jgi:glucosyl-3-phosphoglycerate synthase